MKNPRHSMHMQKGFTLVETLVAISILLLAAVAPLMLASKGLTTSRIARDQVTATYLMQESIETIRFIRDSNRLAGTNWLTGGSLGANTDLTPCLSGSCKLDTWSTTASSCGGVCPVLNFNSTTGQYGYTAVSPWTPTKFTRTITINQTVPDAEAQITVTVSWRDGLILRSISMTDNLMNWQ